MYNHTSLTPHELTNNVRQYIDHIRIASQNVDDRLTEISIHDSNRQLHYYLNMFRNHSERNDRNTALIMLALVRNNLYRYVAMGLNADVNFNIAHGAHILNDIEQVAHRLQVQDAIST